MMFRHFAGFGQRGNAIGWKRSCKEVIEVHPGAGLVSWEGYTGQVAEHVVTRYVI